MIIKVIRAIPGNEYQDYLVSNRNPTLRAGGDLWSEGAVRADDVASTALPDLGGVKGSIQLHISFSYLSPAEAPTDGTFKDLG